MENKIYELLLDLNGELKGLRKEMYGELKEFRNEMNGGFKELRKEMFGEFKELRNEMKEEFTTVQKRMDGLENQTLHGFRELKLHVENRNKEKELIIDFMQDKITELERKYYELVKRIEN